MKTKETKKHGWILQAKNGKFVNDVGDNVIQIKSARVFSTRKCARTVDDHMIKLDDDVVRKVELYKNGKAKKIIKRG